MITTDQRSHISNEITENTQEQAPNMVVNCEDDLPESPMRQGTNGMTPTDIQS